MLALTARSIDMGNTEGIDMVYIYRSSSFRTTRLGRANASGIAIVEHAQKQALKVEG